MNKDPFEEYIRQSEPDKAQKGYVWQTAIGLQGVDGLKPSEYLINTAVKHIEGEISISEAQKLINTYYIERPPHSNDNRVEEADKVSVRIAEMLSENAFSFSPNEYISIHRRLFTSIYSHAGKIRDYNISKKEWVLDGESVMYGNAVDLKETLQYDFSVEKDFNYRNLNIDEVIKHLAVFVSRLWQIHIFGKGNTRTTAVFFIKYLRSLGFNATNDIFAANAWYFRNALVRANYTNLQKGIHETTEFLELFLRNLLLGEKNELKNRFMHIGTTSKVDIGIEKVDIEVKKVDIEFQNMLNEKLKTCSAKTKFHTIQLFQAYQDQVFGRTMVTELLGIKSAAASKYLNKLLELEIIEPVTGHGKGKYRFKAQ